MKTALNIISLAILGAIGAGIYLGADNPDADPVVVADPMPGEDLSPDPAPVADTVPADPLAGEIIDPTANGIVYTVEGTSSGYFIATGEVRFGDLILENIELWPAMPECDEPAYVRLAMEDTSDQLGENEYGPYFRLYAMTIDSASITEEGVMITASDADIGTLVIEADYVDGALAEWQTGADAIGELLVGTATLNGETRPASFAFWVGD